MNHEKELEAIDATLAHDDQALDRLVTDPDENVRVFVAMQGRDEDLDKLVGDPSPFVRMAVAHYGRPEDRQKLASDPSPLVRAQAVRAQAKRQGH